MAMPPPQPDQLNLPTILKESNRITKAHSRHFLALSLLFLLPLSFSLPSYHYIYDQIFSHSSARTIIFSLLYALYVLIFSLLAISSVTYSVFHGFHGRPVKLESAIKSAFTSFPRLLSTCLVSGLIVSGFFLVLALILCLAAQLFGFQINYSSPYFISLRPLLSKIIFTCIAAYIQADWTFAPAVVVVESSWGLAPLKRSKYLVTGVRKVALSIFLVFGYLIGISLWNMVGLWDININVDNWKYLLYAILGAVFASTLLVWSLLSYVAATTVFYVYSKAMHGEINVE